MSSRRYCLYCRRNQPADTFVKLRRGKCAVLQCLECYKARQKPAESKDRLAEIVEQARFDNNIAYTGG